MVSINGRKYPSTFFAVLGFIGLLWAAHMVLAVLTARYFLRLRELGCPCATDQRGTFLFVVSLVHIGLSPLLIGLGLLGIFTKSRYRPVIKGVRSVLSLLQLGLVVAFLTMGLQYLKNIEEEKCACGKDDPRWKALQIWTWLWIAQIGLIVLLLLFVILFASVILARIA